MPTKISYQTWNGGEGTCDKTRILGYCLEGPEEVLSAVLLTHDVHHYKDVYRPIDLEYPNNVTGLVITEASEDRLKSANPGCDIRIVATLSDLNLDVAKTKTVRTRKTVCRAYNEAMRLHSDPIFTNKKYIEKVMNQLAEIKGIIDAQEWETLT